jgi:hypothetical protein
VEVKTGCPSVIDPTGDVSNLLTEELSNGLVPGNPDSGLICRYAPTQDSRLARQITLYRQTVLDSSATKQLASVIGTFTPQPPPLVSSCPSDDGSESVIVFSFHQRSDVDLWYEDSGCEYLDNGFIGAWNTGFSFNFVAEFDQLSPYSPGAY